MSERSYQLIEPFDVDNGELDHLSHASCFVLGVEWAEFRRRLLTGNGFVTLCHEGNAVRLSDMALRHNRFAEWSNFSPGWAKIIVGGNRS
jgi:hypothetical protein